jgi:hypothetical protein
MSYHGDSGAKSTPIRIGIDQARYNLTGVRYDH